MKLPTLLALCLLPILPMAERVSPPVHNASLIQLGPRPLNEGSNPEMYFKASSESETYFTPISGSRNRRVSAGPSQDLQDRVKEAHLSRFASEIEPMVSRISPLITVVRRAVDPPTLTETNIRVMDIRGCRAVLSDVVGLSPGIFCNSHLLGCSITRNIIERQTYETTEGLVKSSTAGAGIDIKFVSVEASFTTENSWVETWASESETGTSWTFDLAPNTWCTPSMVHVELECPVSTGTYFFDTLLEYNQVPERFVQLPSWSQQPRPDANGTVNTRWCTWVRVTDEIWASRAARAELWQIIDRNEPDRGFVYTGLPTDLNDFVSVGFPPLNNNQLIIRRNVANMIEARDQRVMFCCDVARPPRAFETARIPIKGPYGDLPGFIGCVP